MGHSGLHGTASPRLLHIYRGCSTECEGEADAVPLSRLIGTWDWEWEPREWAMGGAGGCAAYSEGDFLGFLNEMDEQGQGQSCP